MPKIPDTKNGPIAWMARNHVAANLIAIFAIIAGGLSLARVRQEVFPAFEIDVITISVVYPGATPDEVQDSVVTLLEEAVRGVEGIKRVNAIAAEGIGSLSIELTVDANNTKVLQDVKNAVDRITTFPPDIERPLVSMPAIRSEVITLQISGDVSEGALRSFAETIRDDLLGLKGITQANLSGAREYEMSIEIPDATLRKYKLTLPMVASIIKSASLDLPSGAIKADSGELLLRIKERRRSVNELKSIPIIADQNGSKICLGDIAIIRDGFADSDLKARYNGLPSVQVVVSREGDQTPIGVANITKKYIKDVKMRIPENISISVLTDRSEVFKDRINLLQRNAMIGLVLVLVMLGLFLNIKLAFWVTLGIPVSFMAAMFFFPVVDISINMVSLFAFIMTLGIVVDDAIVVGENIFTMRSEGLSRIDAAIAGAKQVSIPVIFSIITNIVAFAPLWGLPGFVGKIFFIMPTIVTLVFLASLVEALFVLPSHLSGESSKVRGGFFAAIERVQKSISTGLENFINIKYKWFLDKVLHYRYATVSVGVSMLFITIAIIASDRLGFSMIPRIASDRVVAHVEFPYGTPATKTDKAIQLLSQKAAEVLNSGNFKNYDEDKPCYDGVFALTGATGGRRGPHGKSSTGAHLGSVTIFLRPISERAFSAKDISDAWREATGDILGTTALVFDSEIGGPSSGAGYSVALGHNDPEKLERITKIVLRELASIPDVIDIETSLVEGKEQLDFRVTPEAQALGLSARDIGAQVRGALYGVEVDRILRGREEMRMYLRLPEEDRRYEYTLEQLMIRTQGGGEIPLKDAAHITRSRGYTTITRLDGVRKISIQASIAKNERKRAINKQMRQFVNELKKDEPGLSLIVEGEQRDMAEMMGALMNGFLLVLIVIYGMLAIVFGSYIQPVIIMVSIPFGIVGAVFGHILMGYGLSTISALGVVALAGVVINDTLVLIDFANRERLEGKDAHAAIVLAGTRRFRPIILTSLTTFFGLAPMIFETSMQARFLIPMAISLGYGILFATFIALLLVPALYLVIEDVKNFGARIKVMLFGSKKQE